MHVYAWELVCAVRRCPEESSTNMPTVNEKELVTFDVAPGEYRHWRLTVDGRVATLAMDVNEDCGLKPGYKLKLNSYDLGVDIELHDILQRIRFEHPEVACVVLTSARERMFCAGANIYMLGTSSHAWKVNFCKFTNETRNGMEDSSRHDGLKFLAAINGTCAGGGYELALACDEILLIDDRSSAISLPEVPLLGVLPGTGGLTRVVDKRKVRRDLADMFCTNPDGVKGERAKEWGLVDDIAVPAKFPELVRARAQALVNDSTRPAAAKGIKLTPLARRVDDDGYHYKYVDVAFDRAARTVTLTVRAPEGDQPGTPEAIHAMGDQWWPLAMARELDDAILMLRVNELELGLLLLKTSGSAEAVLDLGCGDAGASQRLAGARDHRPVAPDAGAARCFVAQYLRHHRTGILFRRRALRTCAGGGSQLHAGDHPTKRKSGAWRGPGLPEGEGDSPQIASR